jgi:hypothetical protein
LAVVVLVEQLAELVLMALTAFFLLLQVLAAVMAAQAD